MSVVASSTCYSENCIVGNPARVSASTGSRILLKNYPRDILCSTSGGRRRLAPAGANVSNRILSFIQVGFVASQARVRSKIDIYYSIFDPLSEPVKQYHCQPG